MTMTSFEEQVASLIGEEVLDPEEKRAREETQAADVPLAKRQKTISDVPVYIPPNFDPEDENLYEGVELDYDKLSPSDVTGSLDRDGDPFAEWRSEEESLSTKDLTKRRLKMVSKLQELYKEEYWRLLEELRYQYKQLHLETAPRPQSAPTDAGHGGTPEPGSSKDSQLSTPPTDLDENERSLKQQMSFVPLVRGGPDAIARSLDLPTYSEAEAFVTDDFSRPSYTVSLASLQKWKSLQRHNFKTLERLEQGASAASAREMDDLGAIACLCGRHKRLLVKQTAVSLGRLDRVDLDLSLEGDTKKISRHQARISLSVDGRFKLTLSGKRWMFLNGKEMVEGQTVILSHLSLLDVGGLRFLFLTNHAAVERVLARMTQLSA